MIFRIRCYYNCPEFGVIEQRRWEWTGSLCLLANGLNRLNTIKGINGWTGGYTNHPVHPKNPWNRVQTVGKKIGGGVNCFQKNYLWTDLQATGSKIVPGECCELLSKKLPLDWFTGNDRGKAFFAMLWIAFKKTTFGLIYRRSRQRKGARMLWIAFKKTTFGLIYRASIWTGSKRQVVNCFQKNYLWTDLQEKEKGIGHHARCELLSKKLPLDWFTGTALSAVSTTTLWIAFKKTTFGLIYRQRRPDADVPGVVNCFQKNYLWTDLQDPANAAPGTPSCELLSKKLPLDWFTGWSDTRTTMSLLWIAFKKTTFGLIYRARRVMGSIDLVVNCFQKNYLWTDLQDRRSALAIPTSCELLSKKLPLDWFTGAELCRVFAHQLWIAFKKTTFGLIYRSLQQVYHIPLVVNCFQKNYLWTDLQVQGMEKMCCAGCELLSKKLPLDWFTG